MASRMTSRPPIRSATMGTFTGIYKLTGRQPPLLSDNVQSTDHIRVDRHRDQVGSAQFLQALSRHRSSCGWRTQDCFLSAASNTVNAHLGSQACGVSHSYRLSSTPSHSRACCSMITSKSIISIQPYEARTLIRRRKVETVTIQGDAVFRFCSSRPGDKHGEYHLMIIS
jgi:hypothetical protein